LKLWLNVQRQWSALEVIFMSSQDIRAQLPDDSKRFESLDVEFKDMMKAAESTPMVVESCDDEGRELTLQGMQHVLEKCQKALNEYLDVKKNIFPRFYFVSNVSLLDILSNGNNPPKIMPHIGDLFDGMGSLALTVSEEAKGAPPPEGGGAKLVNDTATHMIAKDGEVVSLHSPFLMKGAVETWLTELVGEMRQSLRQKLEMSMDSAASWDIDSPREKWVFEHCAQIALLTSQIFWTDETQTAFEELESGQEDAMKHYRQTCTSRLEALIILVQGELSGSDRAKVITLITIDVHSRDMIQALLDRKAESSQDFLWQSQLRYEYVETDQDVVIKICDFKGWFSFEYTGNCGRLVITPLTDRCYVTLTTALRLNLGGAP
jgi:dynein heavy chain